MSGRDVNSGGEDGSLHCFLIGIDGKSKSLDFPTVTDIEEKFYIYNRPKVLYSICAGRKGAQCASFATFLTCLRGFGSMTGNADRQGLNPAQLQTRGFMERSIQFQLRQGGKLCLM